MPAQNMNHKNAVTFLCTIAMGQFDLIIV